MKRADEQPDHNSPNCCRPTRPTESEYQQSRELDVSSAILHRFDSFEDSELAGIKFASPKSPSGRGITILADFRGHAT
ncbi:hypothetical protein [Actinokineospora globicatena]|uniref:Uncharacterized protein n=1 Tax=Actinokineospora globicatena TaxID=103729 RepID=A0A9W6QI71_9PSEU|nr:hypothetical protein [Actinokineospora globicatena]GLW90165.1 hypothetical protein Aglo03_09810 [Actinokineospora globicatena]